MERMKIGSFGGLFVFFFIFGSCAHTRSGGGQYKEFEYKELFGRIVITNYIGSEKEVIIPGEINGKKVSTIGENSFSGKQLISIVFPESITEIRKFAFSNNQLSDITIPNGITEIGEFAFSGNKIESVYLPADIAKLSESIFFTSDDICGYYVSSGRKAGIYKWYENKWYYNNELLPGFVTLLSDPEINILKINNDEATRYYTRDIDSSRYFILPGNYTFAVEYKIELKGNFQIGGRKATLSPMTLDKIIEDVTLSEGKIYKMIGNVEYEIAEINTETDLLMLAANGDTIWEKTIIQIIEQ
jgi:hypothetical protein